MFTTTATDYRENIEFKDNISSRAFVLKLNCWWNAKPYMFKFMFCILCHSNANIIWVWVGPCVRVFCTSRRIKVKNKEPIFLDVINPERVCSHCVHICLHTIDETEKSIVYLYVGHTFIRWQLLCTDKYHTISYVARKCTPNIHGRLETSYIPLLYFIYLLIYKNFHRDTMPATFENGSSSPLFLHLLHIAAQTDLCA